MYQTRVGRINKQISAQTWALGPWAPHMREGRGLPGGAAGAGSRHRARSCPGPTQPRGCEEGTWGGQGPLRSLAPTRLCRELALRRAGSTERFSPRAVPRNEVLGVLWRWVWRPPSGSPSPEDPERCPPGQPGALRAVRGQLVSAPAVLLLHFKKIPQNKNTHWPNCAFSSKW